VAFGKLGNYVFGQIQFPKIVENRKIKIKYFAYCPLAIGHWQYHYAGGVRHYRFALISAFLYLLFAIRFSFYRKRFRGVPMSAFDFG